MTAQVRRPFPVYYGSRDSSPTTGSAKVFICWDCDEREAGFSHGEHHRATHSLIRSMEDKESEEDKKVENRLDTMDHKLEGLTSQLMGLTNQMEDIEKLLRSLGNAPVQ